MNDIYKKIFQMSNNDVLLIEYNMFFNDLRDICVFVIDDKDELLELKNVLHYIKSIDKDASFFCCTYGVDRSDDKIYVYCDNLFVLTSLCVEEVQSIFSKYDTLNNPFRGIVPSNITALSVDDMTSETIKYVIYDNGIIKDFHEAWGTVEISKIISILWD